MKCGGRVMEGRLNICLHGRRVPRSAFIRAFAREMYSRFVPVTCGDDDVGIVP